MNRLSHEDDAHLTTTTSNCIVFSQRLDTLHIYIYIYRYNWVPHSQKHTSPKHRKTLMKPMNFFQVNLVKDDWGRRWKKTRGGQAHESWNFLFNFPIVKETHKMMQQTTFKTHPKLANPFPHFLPQTHFFPKPISPLSSSNPFLPYTHFPTFILKPISSLNPLPHFHPQTHFFPKPISPLSSSNPFLP